MTGAGEPNRLRFNHLEALEAYKALGPSRSLTMLHSQLAERAKAEDFRAPAIATLRNWSRRHHWVRAAEDHDRKIAADAGAMAARVETTRVCNELVELRGLQQWIFDRAGMLAMAKITKVLQAGEKDEERIKAAEEIEALTIPEVDASLERMTKVAVLLGRRIDEITAAGNNATGDVAGDAERPAGMAPMSREQIISALLRASANDELAETAKARRAAGREGRSTQRPH